MKSFKEFINESSTDMNKIPVIDSGKNIGTIKYSDIIKFMDSKLFIDEKEKSKYKSLKVDWYQEIAIYHPQTEKKIKAQIIYNFSDKEMKELLNKYSLTDINSFDHDDFDFDYQKSIQRIETIS